MGLLFSRFRKKKATFDILEDLETKIQEIEEYRQNTEQRHKKIVGTLIVYSVVLYIIAALVFYFYFFPAALYDQIFYMTPLLIFPIVILFTKKLVSWYYKRKISRNKTKLSTMQQEKRKILDEVIETETYKKAKEILIKFAPDRLRMTPLSPQPTPAKSAPQNETPRRPSTPQVSAPVNAALPGGGATELRRRLLPVSSLSSTKPIEAPLPRPILPQQRSYLDRLVEYLVGDGPSNRYALICRQCDSHNGMALKEEFEYFGFRCCYCNFWNPARKQKPSAPRLEHDVSGMIPVSPSYNTSQALSAPKISEGLSNSSDTDSDIEVVEKPENTEDSTEEKSASEKEEEKTTVVTEEDFKTEAATEEPTEKVEEKSIEDLPERETEKMEVDGSP
ncbi:endoplasmic reticulum junction formation protein lunapark isoform X2 [Athalia rosae]|uniref:endoplasmic reticulum junction formation protein lunapark isoform X2 n=1 Tax=Athalia rosae TaxID=37344 RepID=UPI002033C067|nr:endoplasmic reticulum junction formation protein lunapark isoform X2 [Athalia rosae]